MSGMQNRTTQPGLQEVGPSDEVRTAEQILRLAGRVTSNYMVDTDLGSTGVLEGSQISEDGLLTTQTSIAYTKNANGETATVKWAMEGVFRDSEVVITAEKKNEEDATLKGEVTTVRLLHDVKNEKKPGAKAMDTPAIRKKAAQAFWTTIKVK